MIVHSFDFNIWVCRHYSGDMSGSFVYCILLTFLALYLHFKKGDSNFLKIFLFGSLCWIIGELVLQAMGSRTWVTPPSIFGAPLYFPLTAIVQGIAEGGIPIAFGYLSARLFMSKRYGLLAAFLLAFFLPMTAGFMRSASMGSALSVSRRALSIWGIAFVTGGMAAAFFIIGKFWSDKRFALSVFGFMCLLGLFWNFGMWAFGLRSMEFAQTFVTGQAASGFASLSLPAVVLLLIFDAIVELAGIYLAFYVIAATLLKAKDVPVA